MVLELTVRQIANVFWPWNNWIKQVYLWDLIGSPVQLGAGDELAQAGPGVLLHHQVRWCAVPLDLAGWPLASPSSYGDGDHCTIIYFLVTISKLLYRNNTKDQDLCRNEFNIQLEAIDRTLTCFFRMIALLSKCNFFHSFLEKPH